MIYLRIIVTAIKRYNIEKQYRQMFRERWPGKKCEMSFGVLIERLASKKLVCRKEMKPVRKKYYELSKLLHGNPF